MKEILASPTVILILGSIAGVLISKSQLGLKAGLTSLKDRFIHSVSIEESSDLYKVIVQYINATWPQKCRAQSARWSKASKNTRVSYSPDITAFTIVYKGTRLLVNCGRDKMEKADSTFGLYFSSIRISGIMAKRKISSLLTDAMLHFGSDRPTGAVGIFSKRGWEIAEVNEIYPKAMDKLIYRCDVHRKIKRDIDTFLASERWYTDRGIPYKRCYCLYGPPGTGKTSMILTIAMELRLDVYLLDLASISCEEDLIRYISDIPATGILVFEDIDRPLQKEIKLSMSSILNILDGLFTKKGMLLFMTTNHIEKLDPALLRDGRIDVKEEIGLAGRSEIEAYLQMFYDLDVRLRDGIDIEMPMASVQEICIRNKNNVRAAIKQICPAPALTIHQ